MAHLSPKDTALDRADKNSVLQWSLLSSTGGQKASKQYNQRVSEQEWTE